MCSTVLPRPDLNHQRRPVCTLDELRLAVHERLELLHGIEDRLDTHSGALLVSMKPRNSILARGVLGCDILSQGQFRFRCPPTDSAEEPEIGLSPSGPQGPGHSLQPGTPC